MENRCIQERPGESLLFNMKCRDWFQEMTQPLTVMQHNGHVEAAV